jgi:hypothetical protein
VESILGGGGVRDREAHRKVLFHSGAHWWGGDTGEQPDKRLRRQAKWLGRSGTSSGCSRWCWLARMAGG